MIRSLYRAQDGSLQTDLGPDEFNTALQDVQGLLWVDFVEEPPDSCRPIFHEFLPGCGIPGSMDRRDSPGNGDRNHGSHPVGYVPLDSEAYLGVADGLG